MPVATFDVTKQFQGVQTVDVFAELRHRDAAGAAQTFTFTQRVLTYPAGSTTAPKNDARLGAISRPDFRLSDRRGQLRGVSCTLDVIDTDYLIRGWLENPFQDNLRDIELTIWIIPEDQRKTGSTPRPYFRGIVREPEMLPDRMIRFVCEDPFTSKFGELVPFYRVARDEFPNAPTASLGVTVSPCYGNLADQGAMDDPPQPTDEASSGAGTGPESLAAPDAPLNNGFILYRGVAADQAGYGALGGTILTGFSMVEDPGAGDDMHDDHTYVGMVTFTPSGGAEGDPHEFLPRDCPQIVGLAATDSAINMSCDAAGGAGIYRFYLGAVFNQSVSWIQRIDSATPAAVFTRYNTPDGFATTVDHITPGAALVGMVEWRAFAVWAITANGPTAMGRLMVAAQHGYRRPYRLVWTEVPAATSYVLAMSRTDPGTTGVGGPGGRRLVPTDFIHQWSVPTTSTNGAGDLVFEVDPTNLTTGEAISGLEEAQNGIVPGVHVGSRLDLSGVSWEMFLFAHGDVQEVVSGYLNDELIETSRYGTDILLPDMTGFSQMSATRTIDVGGRTFVAGFLRSTAYDAYVEAGADAVFSINLLGVEESSTLLTSIYDQIRHVADNFTLAAVPYTSGAWNSPAAFSDATPIVDTDAVAAVKARADDLIPSGQAGAWFSRTSMTRQQLHADLHLSGDVNAGWTPAGQYRIALWDPEADTTLALSEMHDFVARAFSSRDDYQQLENVILHEWRFDVRTGAYALSATHEDAVSMAKYGRKSLEGGTVQFRMRRASGSCGEMAVRRAARYGVPVRTTTVEVAGFHALHLGIGESVAVTHSDGSGQAGWVGRPLRVEGLAPDADGHRVGLVLEDYLLPTVLTIDDIEVEYSASDQDVDLAAIVSAGAAQVDGGTVQFRVVEDDGDPVGSPVVSDAVVAGAAGATFSLPGGTGA